MRTFFSEKSSTGWQCFLTLNESLRWNISSVPAAHKLPIGWGMPHVVSRELPIMKKGLPLLVAPACSMPMCRGKTWVAFQLVPFLDHQSLPHLSPPHFPMATEDLVSHRLNELGACLETPAEVRVCDALRGGTAWRKCATTHTVSAGNE